MKQELLGLNCFLKNLKEFFKGFGQIHEDNWCPLWFCQRTQFFPELQTPMALAEWISTWVSSPAQEPAEHMPVHFTSELLDNSGQDTRVLDGTQVTWWFLLFFLPSPFLTSSTFYERPNFDTDYPSTRKRRQRARSGLDHIRPAQQNYLFKAWWETFGWFWEGE